MNKKKTKSIVLVGMMGAGKTTVGRRLAKLLKYEFIDLDIYIEKKVLLPVAEIFEILGEAYFREQEQKAIQELLDDEPKVIALGGGAFVADKNRNLINNKAISIWLDTEIDILLERVSRNDRRPLLKDKDKRQVLEDLSHKRKPYYDQARVRLDCGNLSPNEIAERIADGVRGI